MVTRPEAVLQNIRRNAHRIEPGSHLPAFFVRRKMAVATAGRYDNRSATSPTGPENSDRRTILRGIAERAGRSLLPERNGLRFGGWRLSKSNTCSHGKGGKNL